MKSSENSISEEQLKKNRRMAIILGISTSIALISVVFGLVQKGVADENRVLIDNAMKNATEARKKTDSLLIQLQQCSEMDDLNKKIAQLQMKRADSLLSLLKRKK